MQPARLRAQAAGSLLVTSTGLRAPPGLAVSGPPREPRARPRDRWSSRRCVLSLWTGGEEPGPMWGCVCVLWAVLMADPQQPAGGAAAEPRAAEPPEPAEAPEKLT